MADFDLFVIGGGSGGVACARRAASHGACVGLVEESRMGGTCVHRGCIPKKFLVYASHFRHDFEDAAGYGWSVGESRFDWPTMVAAKSKELERLEGIYRRLLKDSGVTAIDGRGALLDANTVAIGDDLASRFCVRSGHLMRGAARNSATCQKCAENAARQQAGPCGRSVSAVGGQGRR